MISQGPGGVTGPSTAPAGGTATVKVESGDASVTVHQGGGSTTVPVSPGGRTSVPVPNVPPPAVIAVIAGKGNRKSIHLIEIIGP